MSRDVVVLLPRVPDAPAMLAALAAAGPELLVVTDAEAGVIQLCAEPDRPLVTIEEPMLVAVPGEVERLLDAEAAVPVWWLEIRAAPTRPDTLELAYRVADALTTHLGGTCWPPR